ncbi:sigma-54-dependent transcriptional regulator [Erythrobacter sp. EC-HK427]|uniref:sigma-54-dependent transcriptional regulator n=1 Tax=Erythrobacter sp. EC-HK427 TaxID=2038396 RepID=UPI001255A5A6|nr:sigma-54 dependent transcriptional regulator [Erythrobacter sp. EC-HK427]VVT15462.1 fused DNA-binding response regulator in two-component regulatory system with GlnL: response regulator; sigma54 interaction protein [Erythrobacter sp. EC-HK427]
MSRTALLVEDDSAIATVIVAGLEHEGFTVEVCDSVAGRDAALAARRFDVMLTDVMLRDGDGIESLGEVRAAYPAMPVIIISAQNTLDTAVRASNNQAFEYFPKPFDLDELVRAACQAAERSSGTASAGEAMPDGLPLIGRSAAMQDVYRMITRVLDNDLTVLVLGESGTGKELVAEAIHELGRRKSGPFVAVNTAAIPRELIESELFGHEKGAFTGATARNIGKFEQADGGTLFLDEIGDMPAEAQTRLLRALQSGRIRRVGGDQEIAVNVRIVAATNRDLLPMISAGTFREDLFYRLNVVPIKLPPLRERQGDIEPLARHFLAKAVKQGLPPRVLGDDAARALEAQSWRGNVRELQNLMFRAALLAREERIGADTIFACLDASHAGIPHDGDEDGDIAEAVARWLNASRFAEGALYHDALAVLEAPVFRHALRQTGGNQLKAAQMLGINRNTLRKRLQELGIDPEEFSTA